MSDVQTTHLASANVERSEPQTIHPPSGRVERSEGRAVPQDSLLISVVMPCLNESRTLAACITEARAGCEAALNSRSALAPGSLHYEILIADNGSTDGSQEISISNGARVIPVEQKGYGSALLGGFAAAQGKYIVMGDSDSSYDFGDIPKLIAKLEEGNDLVLGNRFAGGIQPGAMPWHHRYIGNPILSGLGRLLYRTPCRDWHCGLRAFDREKFNSLQLKSTGMEFASEMVLRASQSKLRMAEVPTTLRPDGRDRAPHLRSFQDGVRHLGLIVISYSTFMFHRFRLMYWIGILAAIGMLTAGIFLSRLTGDYLPAQRKVFSKIPVSDHEFCNLRSRPIDLFDAHPDHNIHLVSRERLEKILLFNIPHFKNPTVGLAVHEAGLWTREGLDVQFPRKGPFVPRCKSTNQVLDPILSNGIKYRSDNGRHHNLLNHTNFGIHVSVADIDSIPELPSEFHFGQLAKNLGFCQVPIDKTVSLDGRSGSVKQILDDMFMNYSRDHEQEFFAAAAVQYFGSDLSWRNKFGDVYTFNHVAELLLDRPLGYGACNGTHVLFALAAILKRDSVDQIISYKNRSRIKSHLRSVSSLLDRRQDMEGGWSHWAGEQDSQTLMYDKRHINLLLTGHHLEWIGISEPEDCPSRETVAKAIERTMVLLEERTSLAPGDFKTNLPTCHAIRSILLFSEFKSAAEALQIIFPVE